VFKNTKVDRALAALPMMFTIEEIAKALGHTNKKSAYQTVGRLIKAHKVKLIEKYKYQKTSNF
jgi:prophage antirepressor-like protein